MESDQPAADGFVTLGSYSPHEASKLLERLEREGIPFRAQTRKTPYYLSTEIVVSVDLQRTSDAERIHRDLFGDGLPNYDSAFFREQRNVQAGNGVGREPRSRSGLTSLDLRMETEPESSFLLALREKQIAQAWVAAYISAGLTLILGLLALTGLFTVPGFDAWILLDAAILAGLAFGVAKRSRVCAVFLVVYGISNEVFMAIDGQSFSILRLIFLYFYIRGAIALFRDHRRRHLMPQPTNI